MRGPGLNSGLFNWRLWSHEGHEIEWRSPEKKNGNKLSNQTSLKSDVKWVWGVSGFSLTAGAPLQPPFWPLCAHFVRHTSSPAQHLRTPLPTPQLRFETIVYYELQCLFLKYIYCIYTFSALIQKWFRCRKQRLDAFLPSPLSVHKMS